MNLLSICRVNSIRRLVPWQLVFTQKFDNIEQAKEVERALKKFKRKDIIERIIQEGFIRKEILGGV